MHIETEQRCLGDLGAKGYAPVRIETGVEGASEAKGYAPVRIEANRARMRAHVERPRSLGALSDAELLDCTLAAAGRANQAVVALLAHLAEVEARGVHRLCACSSLYTYCRYELGMPEDTAQRRALAARLVRRFPLLLEKLASGELHLSGLLLLGPHLNEQNFEHLLEAAKHRSKREILSLVRQFDPRPDVPARIEPLGPARRGTAASSAGAGSMEAGSMQAADAGAEAGSGAVAFADADLACDTGSHADPNLASDAGSHADAHLRSSSGLAEAPAEQRFKVQFTAGEEYVRLLQEAQELLGPGENGHVIAEVHLRAMRLFVRELKKRKCALVDKPRSKRVDASTRQRGSGDADCVEPRENGVRAHAGDCTVSGDDPHRSVGGDASAGGDPHRCVGSDASARGAPLEQSRHLPAEVRRAVWKRDEGRCTFVDTRGQRCRERSGLEFHHEIAFAKGGKHKTEFVSLRCKAHNALAAEQDFGAAHMARWSQAP
ncbi:MAG: hypothetical protein R3B13_10700 [Polyangiaceae bacterium]